MSPLPAPRLEQLSVGTPMPPLEHVFTTEQFVRYAGAEEDYMPLHFDHHFALASGQPGVIAHGWLGYSTLLRALERWIPPQAARLVSSTVRYVRPVFPDVTMTHTGTVTAVDPGRRRVDVALEAADPDGTVRTRATATLEFPGTAAA